MFRGKKYDIFFFMKVHDETEINVKCNLENYAWNNIEELITMQIYNYVTRVCKEEGQKLWDRHLDEY